MSLEKKAHGMEAKYPPIFWDIKKKEKSENASVILLLAKKKQNSTFVYVEASIAEFSGMLNLKV